MLLCTLSSFTASQADFFFSLTVNFCSSHLTNGAIIVYWCQRLIMLTFHRTLSRYIYGGVGMAVAFTAIINLLALSNVYFNGILELSVISDPSLAVVYMDTSVQVHMALPHRSFCY